MSAHCDAIMHCLGFSEVVLFDFFFSLLTKQCEQNYSAFSVSEITVSELNKPILENVKRLQKYTKKLERGLPKQTKLIN